MAYTTIDDPEAYFQTQLYTGNGSANHAITLGGDTAMQPDLVWIKNRDAADSFCLFDSARGATKLIDPAEQAAETTDTDTLDSFTSDGFQVDADVKVNTDTEKYVAWCWKVNGGSGSANTDGATASVVYVNSTSKMSIVTWTGTGGNTTVGHGLGVAPQFFATKSIGASDDWGAYVEAVGPTKAQGWSHDSASFTSSTRYQDTAPSSSILTLGSSGNTNKATTMIAYCFADVQGFSKVGGSYVGNANADGPFVYLGFRPAMIITKPVVTESRPWLLFDSKRHGQNAADSATAGNNNLVIHLAGTESSDNFIDFLSNGFKVRNTSDSLNAASEHLYMAFAEAPFVNSNGVPCNAR